jgi:hypothetical protein
MFLNVEYNFELQITAIFGNIITKILESVKIVCIVKHTTVILFAIFVLSGMFLSVILQLRNGVLIGTDCFW